jgi:electron transfer flavoprotein alpha/beta subunit
MLTLLSISLIPGCLAPPTPAVDSCAWVQAIGDDAPILVRGSRSWEAAQTAIGQALATLEDPTATLEARTAAVLAVRSELERPRSILTPGLARALVAHNRKVQENCVGPAQG